MQIRSFVQIVAFLAIVAMNLPQASAQTPYRYADPAGFATLTTPNTATFNFRGTGDLAITSSGFSPSSGISTAATSRLYDALSPYNNPWWIAGNRLLFNINFSYHSGTTPGSTINLDIRFSQPLPAGAYLIFDDFDWREQVRIKAYADDAMTQLIPFANFSFAKENGQDPTGSAADVTWTDLGAAYSGQLASNTQFSRNDPVATLAASTPVKRLIYEVTMDPLGNAVSNSFYFNFTDPFNVVPTASTLAITGTAQSGQVLTGVYVYADADSDVQDTSVNGSSYRFVRSTDNDVLTTGDNADVASGTTGGLDRTYTAQAADVGQYLFYCVTPRALTGDSPGLEACSSPTAAILAPPPVSAVNAIPTLSEWGMILLSVLVALFGLGRVRGRQARR